jgi:hypothetical protein
MPWWLAILVVVALVVDLLILYAIHAKAWNACGG